MALNPGHRKSILRDKDGKILLPLTTASMVSEEPDRRFVDRVEKSLLHSLSDNQVQLEALSEVYTELVLIAANADALILDEERKEAMEILSASVADLALLVQNIQLLLDIANNGVVLNGNYVDGENSIPKQYAIYVDDTTDPDNPVVKAQEIVDEPEEE